MENQNITKKKRFTKPVIILFMVAILFFILGLVDIKVNAAESDTYVSSWWSKVYVDSNGEEQVAKNDWYTYTSSSPLEVYYYQSHDDYVADTPVSFSIAVVSDSPITASGSTSSFKSTEYVFGDKTIYVCMSSSGTSFASPLSGYVEVTTDADNARRLNSSYTRDDFANAYYNNTLDLGNSYEVITYQTTYVYENGDTKDGYPKVEEYYTFSSTSPIDIYVYDSHSAPYTGTGIESSIYAVSSTPFTAKEYWTTESTEYTIDGEKIYVIGIYSSTGFGSPLSGYIETSFEGDYRKGARLNVAYTRDEFAQYYVNKTLNVQVDWVDFILSADVDDDMPIIESLEFDRIESTENSVKKITDYIRFEPNNTYKLVIMLCPSVYSAFESSGYINEFKNYQYDKWVYMTTADKGLKEISCELGSFSIPTNGVESIISSSYKDYYNSILYDLNDSGNLNFKPTMGYRLMYVDLENNMIGPCTYVLPNYYNNLDTDSETYSYFTLYSDNTRGSEKIMNLKTWKQDENTTIEDVKDTIVSVGNVLKDKVVVDNDVDIQEASNWLYSVVNFIGDTPHLIGVVLPFLPKPILYGLYVTVFLGVIASGIAIVKALLP